MPDPLPPSEPPPPPPANNPSSKIAPKIISRFGPPSSSLFLLSFTELFGGIILIKTVYLIEFDIESFTINVNSSEPLAPDLGE